MDLHKIKIENIYYILLYAWRRLDLAEETVVGSCGETELLNLFARLFCSEYRRVVRRCIDQQYIKHSSDVMGVKGKLLSSPTISRSLMANARTHCDFDELSIDTSLNQIVNSVAWLLLRTTNLAQPNALALRSITNQLAKVSNLPISNFQEVEYSRTNQHYKTLIEICQFVVKQLIPDQKAGTYKFSSFLRDETEMRRVFEEFLRGFYEVELGNQFNVGREYLGWDAISRDQGAIGFLPRLETDISIKSLNDYVIIESKYTPHSLAGRFNAEKYSRSHIAQLLIYLQTAARKSQRRVRGILIYPAVESPFRSHYESIHGHEMTILTINLDQPWKAIQEQLLEALNVMPKRLDPSSEKIAN